MKVMVTGSSGFIGSNLVKRLEEGGHEVTKVDIVGGIDTVRVDVSTRKFTTMFKNVHFDCIYHLGSPCSVIQFNRDPVNSVNTTVQSFYNVLDIADDNTRVVYPSSGNVYGRSLSFSESTVPIPTNLYAVSKLACERMASLSGKDTVCFRIFAGYGDGEEKKGELASVVGNFVITLMKGDTPTIWGDGRQTRDFVYIKDVVEILYNAAYTEGLPRVINLGTGESTSFIDLYRMVCETLGIHKEPVFVDKPTSYVESTRADTALMKKYFRIGITPLDKGIRRYINYLSSNGYKV